LKYLKASHPIGDTDQPPLTYNDIYKNLCGMTALQVAMTTPLKRLKDERDTAFVKRIVANYVLIAEVA
jgi:hypothetical protein